MNAPIVILGSGLAGVSVARELRKLDKQVPLVIVTADDGGFYSKPSLSNALAVGKSAAQLALTPMAQLATQLNASVIHAHTRAERILPEGHALETGSGRITYGKLVLALGAQPIRLPLQGEGAAAVLSVNHLNDYAVFREQLEGKRRVAILGAGLIGCEFANDLRVAGVDVAVYDLASQPLGRLLPARAAAFFRARLEAAGVRFHFDTSIEAIALSSQGDGGSSSYRLVDKHGNTHTADLVLSAVGLKPATALAQAAGLNTARGIVVDKLLRTSAPDIYALGDCAEVEGLVLPFVMPIMQAARALAKTLSGAAGGEVAVDYPAMPVVVKTPACQAVVCPPPAGAAGTWREEVGPAGVRALFVGAGGKPLGFSLVGEAVKEKQALAAQMPAWL
ncbi:MAG: FAD-dependent oxidoreductase [Betaproteobacteria bacterium]|nr:FAD-dependent oxidoreductase [Betaproteobacteria bacterium]